MVRCIEFTFKLAYPPNKVRGFALALFLSSMRIERPGSPRQRKMLARWRYGRMVRFIQEECAKLGIRSEAADEFWSSRTCHYCGSRRTERVTQSLFHCWNCELIYNADFNGAISGRVSCQRP